MMTQRPHTAMRHSTRGAALIIVISILSVLLVIASVFFLTTRREFVGSSNVQNETRADLLAEGATSIAIGILKQDKLDHPDVTSTDHQWTTFFNGAWVAGKQWAFGGGQSLLDDWPNNRGQVPAIWYDGRGHGVNGLLQVTDGTQHDVVFDRSFLYVPRFQDNTPADAIDFDRDTNLFVVNPPENAGDLLPAQIIAQWADVDNDGDGLRDSMWMPMAADRKTYFGVEFERDGVDNDLDAYTLTGLWDDTENIDEISPTEAARFVYIDEGGRLRLTIPLPGARVPVDLNADGIIYTEIDLPATMNVAVLNGGGVTLVPLGSTQGAIIIEGVLTLVSLVDGRYPGGTPLVDEIDNDFSQMINDYDIIAYRRHEPTDTTWFPPKNYSRIADYCFEPDIEDPDDPTKRIELEIRCSGEVVSELVGRAAVQIVDAASKVNLNVAGGRLIDTVKAIDIGVDPLVLAQGPDDTHRNEYRPASIAWGASPAEYCTMVLPGAASAQAIKMFNMTTGAPYGSMALWDGETETQVPDTFIPDLIAPGYGFVDDNGNALMLALNGIDDDGDGLIDEGINTGADLTLNDVEQIQAAAAVAYRMDLDWPHDAGNQRVDFDLVSLEDKLNIARLTYQRHLGHFEGVDEPGERQLSRPYRNMVAEQDLDDNDFDDATNEIGEFGDRVLRTQHESKRITRNQPVGWDGEGFFGGIHNLVTLHSSDRNTRFNHVAEDGSILPSAAKSEQGLKLELNLARPEHIALALKDDWGMASRTDLKTDPADPYYVSDPVNPDPSILAEMESSFALGLQLEGITLENAPYVPETPFPADPHLRALQLACNVRDYADTDFARTEATMEVEDTWWKALTGETRHIKYTTAGFEGIRITEMMVRPVRRVEAEMSMEPIGPSPYDAGFDPNLFARNAAQPDDFQCMRLTMEEYLAANPSVYTITSVPPEGAYWVVDSSGGYIGPNTVTATSQTSIPVDVTIPPDGPVERSWPNVIEFSILPSPGLPPGRYYLTVNTAGIDGQPSALNAGDVLYAVKYVAEPSNTIPMADYNSIIQDVDALCLASGAVGSAEPAASFYDSPPAFFQYVQHLGLENMDDTGSPLSGWAFLPSDSAQGFTVIVPEYAIPEEQYSLHIALCAKNISGAAFSINFFDFSQEPDHEWVEIENASGQTVDISGWQLTVGGVDREGNIVTDDKMFMTVPPGTQEIEPGGRRILAVSALDGFVNPADPDYADMNLIHVNGIDLATSPFAALAANPDLIIPMQIDRLTAPGAVSTTDSADIAKWVLRGGVFPNYPEHDGIDNDGDSATLLADGVDNDGDGYIDLANTPEPDLSHDGIDNDGDVSTDEADEDYRFDGFDYDGDGLIDEYPEGVDEGRFRMDTPGIVVPGSFDSDSTRYMFGAYDIIPSGLNYPYMGLGSDPPEWKEFVERRFFPGDNVVITLFEGGYNYKRVVDRVTYTERDVVNRAIDDVVPTVVGGVPIRPNLYGDDVHYLGFWPDNTMGTDFYRTLERKYHALYNGDRFGTSNRWEATDGNYDDWSHDPVLLGNPKWNGSPAEPNAAYVVLDDTYYGSAAQNKKVSDMTREIAVASSLVDNATGYLTGTTIIRCDGFAPVPILNDYCQFAGDPTRYRVIGYDRTNRLLEIDASGLLNPVSNNTAVTIYRKVVALQNNPLVSVGDLMRLPYLSIRKDCWAFGSAVYGGALDDLRLAELQGLLAGHRPYDNDMPMDRDPVWGVNYRAESRYLDALMAVGTVGAKTLTAGQARYYQLNPIEGGVEDEWGAAGVPPQSWRPVHLYPLPAAVAETDDFLFQMPALPDWMVPPTWLEVDGLVDRWALEWPPAATPPLKYPRAAMYVSSNTDAMDIASIMSPHGPGVAAESLFVWTADEGVVNGEYDLYIDVGANLDKIRSGPATSLGQEVATWAGLGGTTLPTELAMDVVALTDRDNNGTCWTEPGPSFATLNMVSESFGMREGLRPDTNGYIHYGMVRVENRYLAVFLRNWTVAGKPNRFLGVILAPRAQTPGRVNVNTVQSLVCDNQARALNPLMGVPGVLLDLYQPTLPPSANPVPPGLPLPALSAAGAATLADDRARIIERDRPEHWDGRYYRFMADVAGYQYPNGGATLTRYPLSNPNYSVTDPAVAQFVFDESAWRMSRMANLITTRSDVFEIVVTAQAGYLANDSFYDDDGNPITPNWRDDENFVVQAETKTRTVYER